MKRIIAAVLLALVAPAAAHADDFVRARGRVMFVDADGAVRPFARVQVRLMDSDWDWDEEIARGFTDNDGRYDISGTAGDDLCVGCGTPDPYVKVVLEEPGRVEVHDLLHYTRNAVITPVREETAGDIDFGERVYPDEEPEGNAAILYVRAQRAYARFTELTGDAKIPGNDGEVAVEIPTTSFGDPYCTWDTIHWPTEVLTFNVFDHEFGHRLRHAADGDVHHFNGDMMLYRYARSHHPNEDTNLGFAFNEGWAQYFRHVLQPDHMDGAWNGLQGDEVEGHVAHKLIFLSDSCGGFRRMWAALKNNPGEIHSFQEFNDALRDVVAATGQKCHIPADVISAPRPPRPAKILDVPAAQENTGVLPKIRDQFRRHSDRMDARSAETRAPAPPRLAAAVGARERIVVERLWRKQVRSAEAADARARAAYRRAVMSVPVMSQRTIEDGSYQRAATAARRAFVTELAAPRLREAQEIRRDIAAERRRTADPAVRSYLARLDAKYARLEDELRRALASRGVRGAKLPLGILPHSFSGRGSARR